ncbi:hypothetical protein TRVL_06269 [Trypanosoma vivax]|nr:hypothetical protein TRVL_06269 [Trypanosoma vivax]
MRPYALAHTICLHHVQLDAPSQAHSSGDLTPPVASLDPLVAFTERGTGNQGQKHSIVEQHASLRSLLQRFCGRLLTKLNDPQHRLRSVGRRRLNSDTLDPVSDEGLFLQVPSSSFIEACSLAAEIGTAQDVVTFNSERCRGERRDAFDEGYLYGYTHFIAVGCAGEGLLLTGLSTSPLFNTLRAVLLEVVPHLVAAAQDVHADVLTPQERKAMGDTISSVYAEELLPLAALVNVDSMACCTPPNGHVYLRFRNVGFSFVRPADMQSPFVDVPLATLCLSFSYDSLRTIHSLLLQGKRVVFIGATPQHASSCVVSVQAMLIPFLWAHPIVPYLPPEGGEIVGMLRGSCGFIVGSTADIIPRLMLFINEEADEVHGRVWFADARTGLVGVAPHHSHRFPFVILDIIPASDKVKGALRRVASREQQQNFRAMLTDAGLCKAGPVHTHVPTGPSTIAPAAQTAAVYNPNPIVIGELHDAFIDYSVYHIVGNYRKGLCQLTTSSSGAAFRNTGSASLKVEPACSLDFHRFLTSNFGGNVGLARRVSETRMYRYWESATTLLETLGPLRSLRGEFMYNDSSPSPHSQASAAPKHYGKDLPAANYYITHPRMLGLLRGFYTRCVRRFPELYNDLRSSDFKTTGSSSKSCKGLMRSLFSMASKAVKNSLTTTHQKVPIRVFVQAYNSFSRNAQCKDPNQPSKLVKDYKSDAAAAKRSELQGQEHKKEEVIPAPRTPVSSADPESECDVSKSPVSECVTDERASLSADRTNTEGQTASSVCRVLPLDVVHNFPYYHSFLDPTCTTGVEAGWIKGRPAWRTSAISGLGHLFAADSEVWVHLRVLEQTSSVESLRLSPMQGLEEPHKSVVCPFAQQATLQPPQVQNPIFYPSMAFDDFGFSSGVPNGATPPAFTM